MVQGSPTSRLVEQRQRQTPVPIASTSQVASTSASLWPLPTNAFRSLPQRGALHAFAESFGTSDDLDPEELVNDNLHTATRLLAQRPTTSKHYVAPLPSSPSAVQSSAIAAEDYDAEGVAATEDEQMEEAQQEEDGSGSEMDESERDD